MPLMQDCPSPLLNSTTGHYYISIGTWSTSLWLAFLANVQQGRVLERGFLALNSMSTRVMPIGNIPEASEIRMPPYYRHTAGSLYGVCIRAAPL